VAAAGEARGRHMSKVYDAKQKRLVLRPVYMNQAFLLVPEDHISSPRTFFQTLSESARPTTHSMTLGTIWGLLKGAWRGVNLPDRLPL
jgi:hypothetical protein